MLPLVGGSDTRESAHKVEMLNATYVREKEPLFLNYSYT